MSALFEIFQHLPALNRQLLADYPYQGHPRWLEEDEQERPEEETNVPARLLAGVDADGDEGVRQQDFFEHLRSRA